MQKDSLKTAKERTMLALSEIRSRYVGGINSSEYTAVVKKHGISAALLFHLRTAKLAEKERRGGITKIKSGVSNEELYSAYVLMARKHNKETARIAAAKKLLSEKGGKKNEDAAPVAEKNFYLDTPSPELPQAERGNTALTEEVCINYLKSKGYRVLKPVTDYKEV